MNIKNLQKKLEKNQAFLISSSENRRYLTGFPSSDGYLLITAHEAVFFIDSRYIEAAQNKITECTEIVLLKSLSEQLKVYAEKLLYLKEGQCAANHFHWYKTEDIINRGGGNVLIRVYNSLENEDIDYESPVTVHTDGHTYTVPAGTQIRLTPGESIHINQYLYHDFAVEEGTGPVLLGEVSQCNDDNTDNRFQPPVGRFPEIEEDEPPYRLLCNEYPIA